MSDDKVNLPPQKRILRIAEKLPSLSGAPGVGKPLTLAKWAAEPDREPIQRVTAKFVLALYDPRTEWGCGFFDVNEAALFWDEEHHRVFNEWARDYWFVSGFEIPEELVGHYPSIEEMSEMEGEPVEKLREEFDDIMRKCGVRNLDELGKFMTIVRLFSQRGAHPQGQA